VRFGSNGNSLYERLRSAVYASPRKRAISRTRSLPAGLSAGAERHELTVNKLIALAGVYGISAETLLRSLYPVARNAYSANLQRQMDCAADGRTAGEKAKYMLSDRLLSNPRMGRRCFHLVAASCKRRIDGASLGNEIVL
jgi:hypothetical protein